MKSVHAMATDAGLFLMRAMLGVVFVFHGGQKLFSWWGGHGLAGFAGYLEKLGVPWPSVSAVAAGATEFFGGLLLLVGLATRLAVVPMVVTMLVASFVAHSGFSIMAGGMEYALTLAVVLTGLGLTGPGRWTLCELVRTVRGRAANTAVVSVAS